MLYTSKLLSFALALFCLIATSSAMMVSLKGSKAAPVETPVSGLLAAMRLRTQAQKSWWSEKTACGYCQIVVGELRHWFLEVKEDAGHEAIKEFCHQLPETGDDDDWFLPPLRKICSEGGKYLLYQELHAVAEATEASTICELLFLCEAPSCNWWTTGVNGDTCYKPILDSNKKFTFQSYEQSEDLCAFHHGKVCSVDDYLRAFSSADVTAFNTAVQTLKGTAGYPTNGYLWLNSKANVQYKATAESNNGAPSGGVNTDRPWSITGAWESIEHGHDKVYQLAVQTASGNLQMLPHMGMNAADVYVAGEGASQTAGPNVGAVVCCREPWSVTERAHKN